MPSRFESSLATLSRSSVFMLFGQTTILYAVAFLASTTPVESSIFPRVALSIVFLVCCDSARPASSSPSITIIFTSLMLSTKNNPHIMPSIIFSRFLLEMPGASKAAPSFMFYQPPHSVLCKYKPPCYGSFGAVSPSGSCASSVQAVCSGSVCVFAAPFM